MSSTTTRSARRIRAIALVTVSSARWRRTRTPRSSRVNQATLQPGVDGVLAEGFEQERLAGPGRAADDQVLPAVDPFQGAQRRLGRGRDRGRGLVPGVEGLAGREPGRGPAGGQRGAVPAGDLLGEQGPEDLGGFPALRLGGGEHLGGGAADVRQPQPAQQRLQLGGQRRRGRSRPPARLCGGGRPGPARGAIGVRRAVVAEPRPTRWCPGPGSGPRRPGRPRPGRGGGLVGEDRGQVGLGEPAVRRAAWPERPVDRARRRAAWPAATASAILARTRVAPGRGGLDQPQPRRRRRWPGTRPRRRCAAPGSRSSGPAGAGGKCASSSRGLPGVVRWWRATSTGPSGADVDDDHDLARRAPRHPHRLARRSRCGTEYWPVLEGDHRGVGRDRAGHPERDACAAAAGSGCSRARSSASISAGGPAGDPVQPGVDLLAERLARRLQLGERLA